MLGVPATTLVLISVAGRLGSSVLPSVVLQRATAGIGASSQPDA
jgi:hypothetical protein